MAIQLRRGNEADLKPDQLVPGEAAVALDTGTVYICMGAGVVEQFPLGSLTLSLKDDLTTEDLDSIKTIGIYIQNYTSNATPDRHYPVKASGYLMCIGDANKTYQYYNCQNEGCIWMRRYNSKTWSDWEQIYPAVTSGSNDNGTWIKYPDGTMICSIRKTLQVESTKGVVVFFPEPFVDASYSISANVLLPYDYVANADGNYPQSTNVWFYGTSGDNPAGEWVDFTITAIGRWK